MIPVPCCPPSQIQVPSEMLPGVSCPNCQVRNLPIHQLQELYIECKSIGFWTYQCRSSWWTFFQGFGTFQSSSLATKTLPLQKQVPVRHLANFLALQELCGESPRELPGPWLPEEPLCAGSLISLLHSGTHWSTNHPLKHFTVQIYVLGTSAPGLQSISTGMSDGLVLISTQFLDSFLWEMSARC